MLGFTFQIGQKQLPPPFDQAARDPQCIRAPLALQLLPRVILHGHLGGNRNGCQPRKEGKHALFFSVDLFDSVLHDLLGPGALPSPNHLPQGFLLGFWRATCSAASKLLHSPLKEKTLKDQIRKKGPEQRRHLRKVV